MVSNYVAKASKSGAFISPTVVDAFVTGRKSKGQFATVKFIKNDGTIRTINGCFAPLSHIVGSERGVMQGEQMKARGQVPIYDVAEGKWKSFFMDKVVEIA
jgi:hypothetical protein